MGNDNDLSQVDEGTEKDPDYKALWEQAKADADRWKAQSRRNEGRAKSNAEAAKSLEEVTAQLADLSERFSAIEGENASLKAEKERAGLVAKVAEATGVPAAIVSTLAASDEDALTEAATAIAEAYRAPGGAPYAGEAGTHVSTGGTSAASDKRKAFAEALSDALGD